MGRAKPMRSLPRLVAKGIPWRRRSWWPSATLTFPRTRSSRTGQQIMDADRGEVQRQTRHGFANGITFSSIGAGSNKMCPSLPPSTSTSKRRGATANRAFKKYYDDSRKHEFMYYDVYVLVKDHPKFMSGNECGGPKRTKVNADGNYTNRGEGGGVKHSYRGEFWHTSANRKSSHGPESCQGKAQGEGERCDRASRGGDHGCQREGDHRCIDDEDVEVHNEDVEGGRRRGRAQNALRPDPEDSQQFGTLTCFFLCSTCSFFSYVLFFFCISNIM